jgi:hypothetical protein
LQNLRRATTSATYVAFVANVAFVAIVASVVFFALKSVVKCCICCVLLQLLRCVVFVANRKLYKFHSYNFNMERTTNYWRYYRTKQKVKKLEEEVEKLRKDVERYKKSYGIAGTLLTAMARFCRNDVVNAERITRYKNALKELKSIVDAETYSLVAPVCEKAINELEKRLQTTKR